jgi:hypothetical protein
MGGVLTLVIMTGCGGSNQNPMFPAYPAPATPALSQLHTVTTIGSTGKSTAEVRRAGENGLGGVTPTRMWLSPFDKFSHSETSPYTP